MMPIEERPNNGTQSALNARESVTTLFGGLRAEWLGPRLYDTYRSPQYLPELLTSKPCILSGGRGTGKTTVLRILSYEGQQAVSPAGRDPRSWDRFGMYWRLDTNRVTAFQGNNLDEAAWIPVFGHYVNLILCKQLAGLAIWYADQVADSPALDGRAAELIARSLHLEPADTLAELDKALEVGIVSFEARINNVVDEGPGRLSLQGAPIELFVRYLRQLPQFSDRLLFFLLDEFENLLDYQQRVINTLIKHSGVNYTFKIGVKVTGHRDLRTLNDYEALQEPADFTSIDISEKLTAIGFSEFARQVCDERLARMAEAGVACARSIAELLPPISEAEEADLLGLRDQLHRLRRELVPLVSPEQLEFFDRLPSLEQYLVKYWSVSQLQGIDVVLFEAQADPTGWRTRLGNYQYPMLFTIKEGKRGLRKLYAGWDTYVQLAAGNLRFLLQLVMEALIAQLDADRALTDPVEPETQTEAAILVGRRNVSDLQGLDPRGGELSRLVLGLGRVFQVMAHSPAGHTPEVVQFDIRASSSTLAPDTARLIESAVRNLAFVRFSGNKRAAVSGETQDWQYALHPIYAAFFGYSYRSKRRMTLQESDLVGLVTEPRGTIRTLLKLQRRELSPLPEQMQFFGGFYGDAA